MHKVANVFALFAQPKRVERRPSLNILLDRFVSSLALHACTLTLCVLRSGILQIPESEDAGGGSGRKARSLAHLQEQRFLDAQSPSAARARAAASPSSSSPAQTHTQRGPGGDISAPAFSPPLPSSSTHIYQYVPYKVLEKRVVVGLALRIVAELKLVPC